MGADSVLADQFRRSVLTIVAGISNFVRIGRDDSTTDRFSESFSRMDGIAWLNGWLQGFLGGEGIALLRLRRRDRRIENLEFRRHWSVKGRETWRFCRRWFFLGGHERILLGNAVFFPG
jgi:hypothetical protein